MKNAVKSKTQAEMLEAVKEKLCVAITQMLGVLVVSVGEQTQ